MPSPGKREREGEGGKDLNITALPGVVYNTAQLGLLFVNYLDIVATCFVVWELYVCYSLCMSFWPKLSSFFAVLLLCNGRCYEAEMWTILLLLRCPFIWYPFWPKSNFSVFGQKPWTIRRFDRNRGHYLWSFYSNVEGAIYEAENLCHSVPLEMPFHMVSFLAEIGLIRFWPSE